MKILIALTVVCIIVGIIGGIYLIFKTPGWLKKMGKAAGYALRR